MALHSLILSAFVGAALAQNIGSGSSGGAYSPADVGTNTTTNATYSNPIMTVNAGDP